MIRLVDFGSIEGPVILCDSCGKQIEDARLANVLWMSQDGVPVFVHKGRCDRDDYLLSMELTDFLGYLLCNAGLLVRGKDNLVRWDASAPEGYVSPFCFGPGKERSRRDD